MVILLCAFSAIAVVAALIDAVDIFEDFTACNGGRTMSCSSKKLAAGVFSVLTLGSVTSSWFIPDTWPHWVGNYVDAFSWISVCCWVICRKREVQEFCLKFLFIPAMAIIVVSGLLRASGVIG